MAKLLSDAAITLTAGPYAADDYLYLFRSSASGADRARKIAGNTLVTLTDIQTLTNKTLTAPTLNGTPTFGSSSNWRTALGLGTIATQAANNIAITGGAIDNTAIGATTASTVKGTTINATSAFQYGGTQVVGARVTGWGAISGTLSRSAYTAYAGQTVSAAYLQAEAQSTDNALKALSQRFAALVTDLLAHGLIGT